MPTLDPEHLLEQAERLASAPKGGKPRQVDLRRAVSSAYYGLFHFLLTAAADKFVGVTRRSTAEYGRVYRSVGHRALRELCEDFRKPTLPAKYGTHLPATGVGKDLPAMATTLVELQDARHAADYDPLARFDLSDAQLAIKGARKAYNCSRKLPLHVKTPF